MRIEQIAGLGVPEPALAGTKPLPDRLKDVGPVLLKGQHKIPAQPEAHLPDQHVLAIIERQHFHYHENIRLVVVEFRPLIGVGHIFEEQGMEVKLLPERFQNLHLVDTPDIQPGDGLIGRWRKNIE